MSTFAESLPLVHPLPPEFSLSHAFTALSSLPGVLWLDSAAQIADDTESVKLGRFSFLTADPIRQLIASVGDNDPWPVLDEWCRELPATCRADLPPFQGGIAGVIGYEAACWLENVPVPTANDLSTPALSVGLYDWTIALDHVENRAWIVCQGLGPQSNQDRLANARDRRDQVLQWLADGCCDAHQPSLSTATIAPAKPIEGFPTQHAGVTSNFPAGAFSDNVGEIVRRIRAGDSFQVNLAQRLVAEADGHPAEIYSRLRQANPAPFGGYFAGETFSVLSSSPEGFLTVRDRKVQTRPIKGTVARTGDIDIDRDLAEQLAASEKDRAENIMIVDLMRNDLSRVCIDESVVVTQLCQIERYQYVQHLVSVIEGELAPNATICDLIRACFPGGSVTGAPKIEAMQTIAELEPNPRGPYCGSLGYISCGGAADFNILIRTIVATAGHLYFPVGGGITARSNALAEEAETWTKARGMLQALRLPKVPSTLP